MGLERNGIGKRVSTGEMRPVSGKRMHENVVEPAGKTWSKREKHYAGSFAEVCTKEIVFGDVCIGIEAKTGGLFSACCRHSQVYVGEFAWVK